jgi:hypothetical protein
VLAILMPFVRCSLGALALLVSLGATPAQEPDRPDVCRLTTSERIVAVGDVHGAYDRFTGILRAAGLVDGRGRWTGGRAVLVQTGDILDRGPDSRRILDLLMRLERDAARAGGAVHALLGNHEAMRIFGQWQDVSAEEYAAFRTPESTDVREAVYEALSAQAARDARGRQEPFDARAYRERFMREVPLGFVEMRQAFGPSGTYGTWLRLRPAVVRINGIVFVHGGIDPSTAAIGCAGINETVTKELTPGTPPTAADLPVWMTTRETGPLWYRGLALAAEAETRPEVEKTLAALEARAMVVGHSPVNGGRITTRFGGQVILLDTGMLGGRSYPGGVPSALQIQGNTIEAVYTDRREALPPLR